MHALMILRVLRHLTFNQQAAPLAAAFAVLIASCGVSPDTTAPMEPASVLPIANDIEPPVYTGQTISVMQEFDEGGLSTSDRCPDSTAYCRRYHRVTLDNNGLITRTTNCIIMTPGDANQNKPCKTNRMDTHQLEESTLTQLKSSLISCQPHLFKDEYSCEDEHVCTSDDYGIDYRIDIDGLIKSVKLYGGEAGISDPSFYHFRKALRAVGFQGPYDYD